VAEAKYPDGERLKSLLLKEKQLYGRLAEMTERQRVCIDKDDRPGLLGVVGEKQHVIDKLETIEKELKDTKADWSMVRNTIEPRLLAEIDPLISDIENAIKALLKADEICQNNLREKLRDTVEKMKHTRTGQAAARTYAPKPLEDNRFFDKTT